VVLVNSLNTESGAYTFSISVDNQHGACLATDHLLKLGHRRIAYITGPANHSDDLDRLAGYREALDLAGIAFDGDLVIAGTGRAGGGERALPQIIALDDPPTAVFCYNDMTAIGVLQAARKTDLTIPQDLAVVGFDDIPLASFVYPPLTTVAQSKHQMGQRAVEMVLTLIEGNSAASKEVANVVVQGKLIVRESSAA
jgi:DNA-binding LacI/PurR family transcriptional regulator